MNLTDNKIETNLSICEKAFKVYDEDVENLEDFDSNLKEKVITIEKKETLNDKKITVNNKKNDLKIMIQNIKEKNFDTDADNRHTKMNCLVESNKNLDHQKIDNSKFTSGNQMSSGKSEVENTIRPIIKKLSKRKNNSDISEINKDENNKDNHHSKSLKILKDNLTGSSAKKGKKFTFNEISDKSKIDLNDNNTPNDGHITKLNQQSISEINFNNINMKVFSNSNDLNHNLRQSNSKEIFINDEVENKDDDINKNDLEINIGEKFYINEKESDIEMNSKINYSQENDLNNCKNQEAEEKFEKNREDIHKYSWLNKIKPKGKSRLKQKNKIKINIQDEE